MNNYYIHNTATLDKNVFIGNDTKVWHYSHISEGVTIGKNCVLGQSTYIGKNVVIGNNVKIQNNVSVFENVKIMDDVFCGPNVVFTNVINPRAFINRKSEFKSTLINNGATLGANCTIICGNKIGEYSFIGAGSVITKDTKNYSLVFGNPGSQKGWVSKNGLKLDLPLEGNHTVVCPETKKKYKLIKDVVIELQ